MAMLLSGPSLEAIEWLWILFGLLGLVLGWWRGSSRGVWRPRLNGIGLAIAGVAFAVQPLIGLWTISMPLDQMQMLSAALCAFSTVILLILALEKPRPRPLRYLGSRMVPILSLIHI